MNCCGNYLSPAQVGQSYDPRYNPNPCCMINARREIFSGGFGRSMAGFAKAPYPLNVKALNEIRGYPYSR